MASVLFMGIGGDDPSLDLPPNVSSQQLNALIDKGAQSLTDAGYKVTLFLPPMMDGITALEKELQSNKHDLVLVGVGIRLVPKHTPYFEGIINTVLKYNPGQRFAFNASLERTVQSIEDGKLSSLQDWQLEGVKYSLSNREE
ncbi:hypothetical protein E8E13_004924 [Curvularia kusanoi]|uniref:Uncharacterized protein n=1 Tax=Curvularia kusanoi TaxID=90978 RepID=A0A9P4T8X7_CURKU|nr:hypothetical protein E8E13_004924 [Curvularia kusanoi]